MSSARRWQDVKAGAHRRHPELADPQLRARADAQLDAQVAGFHLGELRKLVGKTSTGPAARSVTPPPAASTATATG